MQNERKYPQNERKYPQTSANLKNVTIPPSSGWKKGMWSSVFSGGERFLGGRAKIGNSSVFFSYLKKEARWVPQESCDFPAGAAGARSAYYVWIFQPELQEHAPRTTFLLKSCDFKPELPRIRGESNPRPRDCESRRTNHETTSKGHFASRLRRIRTAPQRERFDTRDLRRGSRGHRKKTQNTSRFCTSTTPIPAEGSSGNVKNAKTSRFCTSTTPISAEGCAAPTKTQTKPRVFAPQPRRSPQRVARAPQKKQKPRVFAPQPRRSPQRVAREHHKTQKTSSFCTSTTRVARAPRKTQKQP